MVQRTGRRSLNDRRSGRTERSGRCCAETRRTAPGSPTLMLGGGDDARSWFDLAVAALPRELGRRVTGRVGPADRRDEVASARRRARGRGGGVGAGRGRATTRRARSVAMPRRSRTSFAARTTWRASTPTRFAPATTSRATSATRSPRSQPDDRVAYVEAVESVLGSFERRSDYLEDVAVADTVLVLQALAEPRGMRADLDSRLLPG